MSGSAGLRRIVAFLDRIEPDQVRRLRRVEYDRLVELGMFADERVELLHAVQDVYLDEAVTIA